MEKGFPISPDRAIFLADAHLNKDDINSRYFLALVDRAAAEKVPLFLLGDVFDLWFGNPGLTFAFQKPIVEQLRRLRGEGLPIYYVEGNRDFYLKRDHDHEGTTFDVVSLDFVVLGHFHQEKLMRFSLGKATKVLAVLPSWKDRWRYFYLTAGGAYGFRAFNPGEPLLP